MQFSFELNRRFNPKPGGIAAIRKKKMISIEISLCLYLYNLLLTIFSDWSVPAKMLGLSFAHTAYRKMCWQYKWQNRIAVYVTAGKDLITRATQCSIIATENFFGEASNRERNQISEKDVLAVFTFQLAAFLLK